MDPAPSRVMVRALDTTSVVSEKIPAQRPPANIRSHNLAYCFSIRDSAAFSAHIYLIVLMAEMLSTVFSSKAAVDSMMSLFAFLFTLLETRYTTVYNGINISINKASFQ